MQPVTLKGFTVKLLWKPTGPSTERATAYVQHVRAATSKAAIIEVLNKVDNLYIASITVTAD